MKITVTLQLEVDADGWTMNYGIEGAAAIREDVKAWTREQVDQSHDNITVRAVK